MIIIPAMDIIDGKCVRLTQGDFSKKTLYAEDPTEMAKCFEDAGCTRLHLVDLDGAKAKHIVNHKVLESIAKHTQLQIDFGGGVKSDTDITMAFDCGAQQITAGSIAVSKPEKVKEWIRRYGAERIILGADVKNGNIAVSGWQETTSLEVVAFVELYVQHGIQHVICTDISKDGMLQGPARLLYEKLSSALPEIQLTASGGVSSLTDLRLLQQIGCSAAIVGKAIYEGSITLSEVEKWNTDVN
ncbi:1-(5-phosphoribosyl)-5-[(5-phosphoribosylamino)methylideneamino]imidazole-4-carboxamide isomerase [Altibacter sp. HG106]|uniref:1-(5-phosphoribosyl)-5-[(5- phosphoribosylamino)methylideneamino]imidazole-4- carboxamide isomerase n=1 Tax=Altibacter sp. HG106 TaxID=3023937 RepID=UPI0023502BAC|nr:1-(5-phosphoribosyl)-5-[(5-phosphoribosylamino)methylideneamino]imidazole-4-carboxamide isomerase [Altibacter sp. HG106]MDC7993589.1 1-(5-phosphoribosyl)-5-[(5-phosphoribosylamino)methylideneamino]imidazole-4-carboxamide isomerase [Altibacter sp. HG106]